MKDLKAFNGALNCLVCMVLSSIRSLFVWFLCLFRLFMRMRMRTLQWAPAWCKAFWELSTSTCILKSSIWWWQMEPTRKVKCLHTYTLSLCDLFMHHFIWTSSYRLQSDQSAVEQYNMNGCRSEQLYHSMQRIEHFIEWHENFHTILFIFHS